MRALDLVVSEKKFFLYFHHDAPRAGPVWTTGARMAGFIKRNTVYCYTQNMKALGLVVSEKKIFIITEKMFKKGSHLYACFVDFEKALQSGEMLYSKN